MTSPPVTKTAPLNLFVAHSPFQYFVAGHMVTSMSEFAKADNILIVDQTWPLGSSERGGWRDIIVLDPPVGPSVIGAGRLMRKVINRIRRLLDDRSQVGLFLPNVQWPLCNVLHGCLTRGRWVDRVSICNYPEGVGSLRVVHPDWSQRCRDFLKGTMGLFGGVRYRVVTSDLMGLETAARIYSLLPCLLPEYLRTRAVQIPAFRLEPHHSYRETCIFLGQNDRLLPQRLRQSLAERAAEYCRKLDYRRFLYKPHHYGESGTQRDIFLGAGFNELKDSRPVEQILMIDPVACVVSYGSSALVHLKMMFNGQIRCVACFPNEFERLARQKHSLQNSVVAIFEQTGVEIFSGEVTTAPGSSA